MRLFSALYDRVMSWSRHRFAPWYLMCLSFAESSFFPIPPDLMLAPMSMTQPNKAWRFAALTTVMSVLGGLLGYLIGLFAFDLIALFVEEGGRYQAPFEQAKNWFREWGVWAVFIAGFSPIPYKIFTITAGFLSMALLPFVLASAIGRGSRFFLVAALIAKGGAGMERRLRQLIDMLGWAVSVIIVLAILLR